MCFETEWNHNSWRSSKSSSNLGKQLQIPAKDPGEGADGTWYPPCCSGYQQCPAERDYQRLLQTSTGIFFCPNNFLWLSNFYTIKTSQVVQCHWWQRSRNYQGRIGSLSVYSQHEYVFCSLAFCLFSEFFPLSVIFLLFNKVFSTAYSSLAIGNRFSMVHSYSAWVTLYLVHMKYPTSSETEDTTQIVSVWACPE